MHNIILSIATPSLFLLGKVYATNRLSIILKLENTSPGKEAIMLEDKSLMKQAIEKYIDEEIN